jgi:hypothetical protein
MNATRLIFSIWIGWGGGGQHPVGLTFMTGASTLRAAAQGVRQPAGAALEYILHKIGRVQKKKKKIFRAAVTHDRIAYPSKENLKFLPEAVFITCENFNATFYEKNLRKHLICCRKSRQGQVGPQ